jgi:hypothetical protein
MYALRHVLLVVALLASNCNNRAEAFTTPVRYPPALTPEGRLISKYPSYQRGVNVPETARHVTLQEVHDWRKGNSGISIPYDAHVFDLP